MTHRAAPPLELQGLQRGHCAGTPRVVEAASKGGS